MEFLANYALFLSKSLTLLVLILFGAAALLTMKRKKSTTLEIKPFYDAYRETQEKMHKATRGGKLPKLSRAIKKERRLLPALYVLDFVGDIKANEVATLRQAVSAVLSVAKDKDEVMIRLESPGGAVNGYGLAAAQLQRIRDKKIPLTVCIDKVAASGGYLMACCANQIVAAPFAIVGSIGVVAQLPNFHRLLKHNHVDVELFTAGEFKRTVTLFGENTEKGREKFQAELEQIHALFKQTLLKNRPTLDMEKVATGEHWLAMEAYKYRLVDHLKTSDDFLSEKCNAFNVFEIVMPEKGSLLNRLMKPLMRLFDPF